jgi:ABC-type uncharacterized transport system permease subunit
MARTRSQGNGRIEELIATILQTQASLQQNLAIMQQNTQQNISTLQQNTLTMQAEWSEFRKQSVEVQRSIDQRFARIEALLLEHHRMLEALPDAIRDKIGFKPQQGPT